MVPNGHSSITALFFALYIMIFVCSDAFKVEACSALQLRFTEYLAV